MFFFRRRSKSEMSSGCVLAWAYVSVPYLRVPISTTVSLPVGMSDHRAPLRSARSIWKLWGTSASKSCVAFRISRGFTVFGVNASAGTRDS